MKALFILITALMNSSGGYHRDIKENAAIHVSRFGTEKIRNLQYTNENTAKLLLFSKNAFHNTTSNALPLNSFGSGYSTPLKHFGIKTFYDFGNYMASQTGAKFATCHPKNFIVKLTLKEQHKMTDILENKELTKEV